MTYGTRQLKNGNRVGVIEFSSGKRVFLNHKERQEFDDKVEYWIDSKNNYKD